MGGRFQDSLPAAVITTRRSRLGRADGGGTDWLADGRRDGSWGISEQVKRREGQLGGCKLTIYMNPTHIKKQVSGEHMRAGKDGERGGSGMVGTGPSDQKDRLGPD